MANQEAQKKSGIAPSRSLQERLAIQEAITSSDPERRRTAYLASGNVHISRATHELVKELRTLRPALDQYQRANDEFADTLFEGDLLRAEGKLEEAVLCYQKAHSLQPKDGFAAVALANALMDLAFSPASDGSDWNPSKEKWVDSVGQIGQVLLPILEEGSKPTNPAYLPAIWAHAHLWYHCAEGGVANAVGTSTASLLRADQASPDNPVTLRLLGRNFYRFTREKECAEPYFKRAIDADPEDIKQKFHYALYLSDLPNRDVDAAVVFEQCLNINPDHPHVLEAFAFLLSKQSTNAARAELMWKHALRIAPKHPVGRERYGRFLASKPDRLDRAEEVYQRGLANRPNDAELWAAYAILLESQPGREKDAIAAYDKVLAVKPHATRVRVRSVMHKIVAGEVTDPVQEGLQMVNEGLTNDDSLFVVAGAWLGLLYAKSEEQLQALKLLKSLREHFGDSMGFIRQPRNVTQAIAAGNKFAAWLDPLSKVIAGDLPISALDAWEVWNAS